MEEKRILWICAAVGIFLSIVIGTALILHPPRKNITTAQTNARPQQTEQTWVLSPQASGSAFTAQPQNGGTQTQTAEQPAQNAQAILPSDAMLSSAAAQVNGTETPNTDTQTDNLTTIDIIGASKSPEQQTAQGTREVQGTTGTQSTMQAQPTDTAQPKTASSAPSVPASKPKGAAIHPAPPREPAKSQTAAKPQPKPASAPAKPTATPKAVDRYWVQAAAFTDKTNAETARGILADEKIPAEIFTYQDKKGLTYYRLRVGPYTTESEAEYWNSRIKLIDHFASSQTYVTNSSKAAR